MHFASAAFEFLAYTKSNKHFGMDNVTLFTIGGLIIGALVFFGRGKKK